MTPQEALAQALHGNGEDGCSASLDDCDVAILDALPEGWVLAREYLFVRDPDDEIVGYGSFHVERMDDDDVWIGLGHGPAVHLDIVYAKGRKVGMVVRDERRGDDPTNRDLPTETLRYWEERGAQQERERLRATMEKWDGPDWWKLSRNERIRSLLDHYADPLDPEDDHENAPTEPLPHVEHVGPHSDYPNKDHER